MVFQSIQFLRFFCSLLAVRIGVGWRGENELEWVGKGKFWNFQNFIVFLLILDVVVSFEFNLDAFMALLSDKRAHET